MRRKLLALLAAGVTVVGLSAPAVGADGVREVAPGVELTSLVLGQRDADDRWTVQVYLPAVPDGPLGSAGTGLGPRGTADRVARELRAKGFAPRIEEVVTPAFADRKAGRLGWVVRLGLFEEAAGAEELLGKVKKAGFAGGTRYTAQDGTDAQAPQRVHVLRVDFRKFRGSVGTDFGPTLYGPERLTDLMASAKALAGVNGQWFYDSAPGGLYVKDGKLIGSATQGRAGLMLRRGGRSAAVDTYTSHVTLRAGGQHIEVDGVNRQPGVVWNCGGVGGDVPTQKAQHDFKCTDDSELVRFTPEWGAAPTGAGAEAVLDARGKVVAVNSSRGAAIPAGGSTVQAIGSGAQWLQRHVAVGATVRFDERVEDGHGRRVALTPDTTILQVGPALVRNGRVAVNAQADGIIREGSDQTFTYNWTVRANPRSMVGVDARGRLLLVVVDGRQAGYSEGLGVAQAAELMRRLGAREALNLDGGGSSVMATARDGIVNRPSDSTGQRTLGNALLVRP
ncbi:hypothetical protein GCM10010329_79770 [Streptomyces spiroverticillatus]|nr:hypothetical protein GCM10010329_79770 [Streptomyces spiroverticillatus]